MLISSLLVTAIIISASSAAGPLQHVGMGAHDPDGAKIEAILQLPQQFGIADPPP